MNTCTTPSVASVLNQWILWWLLSSDLQLSAALGKLSLRRLSLHRLALSSVVLTTLLLSACSDDTPAPTKRLVDYNGRTPDERGYQQPHWPRDIRQEVYGDPDIFSTPRIQFTAQLKWDEDYTTLWSMRLDGSDKRRVADRELMFDGAKTSHTPVRSPNNRYVAVSMRRDNPYKTFRGIIDLKTQTKWEIAKGGGVPHFNWTSDSENVIFYADGKHYNYHLPSRTLSERPIIYSAGLFLLPGDERFLAFKRNGYWLHDFEGNVLDKVQIEHLNTDGSQSPVVSPDGKWLFFVTGGWEMFANWINIETGEFTQVIRDELISGRAGWSDIEDTLYVYQSSTHVTYVNLVSGEKRQITPKERLIWGIVDYSSRTLYNYHATHKDD